MILSIIVSEKMGLPYYRRRRGRGRGRNTYFLEKWLFSIIYFEKTIQSIFMKFSGFVSHVKDYCCASGCWHYIKSRAEELTYSRHWGKMGCGRLPAP